jgi:hypothetical protein
MTADDRPEFLGLTLGRAPAPAIDHEERVVGDQFPKSLSFA